MNKQTNKHSFSDCGAAFLGSRFLRYPEIGVSKNNDATIHHITLDDCKQRCLAATSYTCRHVELDGFTCFNSRETFLTVKPQDRLFTDEGSVYYQRTCQ